MSNTPKPTAYQKAAAVVFFARAVRPDADDLALVFAQRDRQAEQRGQESLQSAIDQAGFHLAPSSHAPPGELTLWCNECGRDSGFHYGSCSKSEYQRGREAGILEAIETAITDARSKCGGPVTWPNVVIWLRKILSTTPPAAPLTGPELAERHGFSTLAESGAARVPSVPHGEVECTCFDCDCRECKANNRRCSVHGRAAGKL